MNANEYISMTRQKYELITFEELSREIEQDFQTERESNSLMFRMEFFLSGRDFNAWGWDGEEEKFAVEWLTQTGFVKVCLILLHDRKITLEKANCIYRKYFNSATPFPV